MRFTLYEDPTGREIEHAQSVVEAAAQAGAHVSETGVPVRVVNGQANESFLVAVSPSGLVYVASEPTGPSER